VIEIHPLPSDILLRERFFPDSPLFFYPPFCPIPQFPDFMEGGLVISFPPRHPSFFFFFFVTSDLGKSGDLPYKFSFLPTRRDPPSPLQRIQTSCGPPPSRSWLPLVLDLDFFCPPSLLHELSESSSSGATDSCSSQP